MNYTTQELATLTLQLLDGVSIQMTEKNLDMAGTIRAMLRSLASGELQITQTPRKEDANVGSQ
jgi:hypothetical protein